MDGLFVYGTLRDEARLREVLGRVPASRPAVVHGFRLGVHPRGTWPTAERDADGSIQGLAILGLAAGDLDRLDRYEGVGEGLYERVPAEAILGRERLRLWIYASPRG